MPKANETKKVKLTAEADTKKEEKVTEVKAAEPKAPAKAAEAKTTAEAAEPKAPAAKKSTTKKAASAEKAAAVKKTADKEEAEKAQEKTTTAEQKAKNSKKVTESVWIQYAGREIEVSDILERAKAAYAGDAKKMTDIRVYVKPEENKAYFVVNGDETGCVAL